MHARPRSIAALLALVSLRSCTEEAASAAHLGVRTAETCVLPSPRRRRHHPHQGAGPTFATTRPAAVEGVKITVEDDAGEVVGEGHQRLHRRLRHRPAGGAIDVLGKTYTVKLDEESLPEGRRSATPTSCPHLEINSTPTSS